MEAGFGAVFGLAIQWGVKRGIYSNEAGQGTAPHIAQLQMFHILLKQGLVQSFRCILIRC
jgi:AGCS family alanine or glycine:cation symporter